MVLALVLAQLVLPGPPSKPLSPPGMICASGDCSGGPVVYRTSAGPDLLCGWTPPCETYPCPVEPPEGLGWDPGLGVMRHADGRFTASVDVSEFAPEGLTYYVGWPGASSANDCLTPEASCDTIGRVWQKSGNTARRIYLYPRLYTRSEGQIALNDDTRPRELSIIGLGGVATLSMHDLLTWTKGEGLAYSAPRSAAIQVWDARYPDAHGDYRQLDLVESAEEVSAAPGRWYTDNVTVWVSTHDGRPPDEDIRVYLNVSNTIIGNATIYLENLALEGGASTLRVDADPEGNSPQVYAKNVRLKYSNTNGLSSRGAFTHFQDSTAARNKLDGFNYHTLHGVLSKNIEVNCTGRDNGVPGTATNNGSSTHDGMTVVRVGGSYFRNHGPNLPDVNGSKAWMLGTVAGDSRSPPGNQADLFIEGTLWCDGCRSTGRRQSLRVYSSGSMAFLRAFRHRAPTEVSSGAAIECY